MFEKMSTRWRFVSLSPFLVCAASGRSKVAAARDRRSPTGRQGFHRTYQGLFVGTVPHTFNSSQSPP